MIWQAKCVIEAMDPNNIILHVDISAMHSGFAQDLLMKAKPDVHVYDGLLHSLQAGESESIWSYRDVVPSFAMRQPIIFSPQVQKCESLVVMGVMCSLKLADTLLHQSLKSLAWPQSS